MRTAATLVLYAAGATLVAFVPGLPGILAGAAVCASATLLSYGWRV